MNLDQAVNEAREEMDKEMEAFIRKHSPGVLSMEIDRIKKMCHAYGDQLMIRVGMKLVQDESTRTNQG